MPISSYPRLGHPIAPSLLSRFLRRRTQVVGVRFSELDATSWDRFGTDTCRRLGKLLIKHLVPQLDDMRTLVGSKAVAPPTTCLTLDQLDLEVRTFDCLSSIGIDARPGGIAGLTICDALEIHAFGVKSLVDLLTSVEAALRDGHFHRAPRDKGHVVSKNIVTQGCCEVIRWSGCVPRAIADLHVPAPPRGIKLAEMGLRTRTLNALQKAGYRKDPTKIGGLTLGQAAKIPNFGAESLCDLIEAVERLESARYPLLSPLNKLDECRLLLEVIRANKTIPKYVLECEIPPLPPRTAIEDLHLCRRTRKILERERIAGNLEILAKTTVHQMMGLRGFGESCIIDLLESVCRVRESAGFLVRPNKSAVHDVNEAIHGICSVLGIQQVDQSDPRLGRLLRKIHSGVAAIGDLAKYRDQISILGRHEPLRQLRECIERCTRQTIESELVDLIVGSHAAARNRDVVAEYYGFRGHPLVTLQVLGDRHNVTRERVRQICAPTKISKLPQPPFAPVIDSALALIRDAIPASRSSIEQRLVEQRLIEPGTSLQSVERVAQFLGREVDFGCVGAGALALALPTAQVDDLKRIEQTARKLVHKFGAAVMNEVLERCDIALPVDKAIELVTAAGRWLQGFRWLDQSVGWFWFGGGQNTRLRRGIRKVLSVCGEIDVGELRAAIRRNYHLQGRVPPKMIILELCRQIAEVHVDGERVGANLREDPMTLLKGEEARLVGLLLKHGPICRREDLQEKATALGMGVSSFWRCLQFSPTISRYARGLYGLTGAETTPAMLESLNQKRPTGRVVQDHGWTDDGRIWIAYRISPTAIETGVVGVPAAKRNLVQGEFQLTLPSGEEVGTLTVKESSAWGLGPHLRRSGTEANDYLLIVFDVAKRIAVLRVGDAGLIDELQGGRE